MNLTIYKVSALICLLICLFFSTVSVAQSAVDKEDSGPAFSKLRLGVYGGTAYRLGKNQAEDSYSKNYNKGLRWGVSGNADLNYFFTAESGVGVRYSFFNCQNFEGEMQDKVYINYVGLNYAQRSATFGRYNNWALVSNVSLGYLEYVDEGVAYIPEWEEYEKMRLSTETLGIYGDLGVEVEISKKSFLCLQFFYLYGYQNEFDLYIRDFKTTIKLDDVENLSQIGFNLGLRFGL